MAKIEAEADLLSCPVCLDVFKEPVLIGVCGHTFCKACVQALPRPECPNCRAAFTPSAVLPNFALRHLLRDKEVASSPRSRLSEVHAPVCPPEPDDLPMPEKEAPHEEAPHEEPAGIPMPVKEHKASPGEATKASSASAASLNLAREDAREISANALLELGVPYGLAELICEEDQQVALKIFLLDNSGSTAAVDGQYLEEAPGVAGGMRLRQCTRWQEVTQLAIKQAEWNLRVGTPCEFVLLNPGATGAALEEGLDFQRIDSSGGDAAIKSLKNMLLTNGPRGVTPLADRLRRIRERVKPQARDLARKGQKVVLVIATDGLPTDTRSSVSEPRHHRELVQELQALSYELPMHIVVRLCTNEESVAEFYNSIDEDTELELEVIDDMHSEATEITRTNRWLVYSPLIHLLREGGTLMKLFDIIDERALSPMEIVIFAQLLLKQHSEDQPLPTSPQQFCSAVGARLPLAPSVYDPISASMGPPLIHDKLVEAVLQRAPEICGVSCSLQ